MNYNLIFYDFEVFKYDWLVVLIDYKSMKKHVIINDSKELLRVYNNCKKRTYIWVGYNNKHYDSVILKGILNNYNPAEINNSLINDKKKEYQILSQEEREKYPVLTFDISDRLHSLKQFEGFMGEKIKESDIDFTIDRKLTEAEIQETVEYCTHDVEQTVELFNNKREEFDSQASLIEAFDLPLEDFSKTKAQLVAKILKAERVSRDDEFDIIYPDTLILDKYKYVLDWFQNPVNHRTSKNLYTNIAGIPHIIGWGGIHGSIDNSEFEGELLCADVASLYPSIMIEYGLLSRNVPCADDYRKIRDTRLKLKKEKNPMQLPYKIVLNSTYGASGDKGNPLFDLRMCRSVCVTGQLLLIDLIEKIEPFCQLIQSNTDGVYLKVDSEENKEIVISLMHEWENRTRLSLEIDKASRIVQKDVNNYILVEDGDIKTKGAYVKKLSKIDYDLPILNQALYNYYVKNKPLRDTIYENDNLIDFQKIIKLGGTYKYFLHGDKPIREKVLRIFASTNESNEGIFKIKEDGNPEKVANTPEHSVIYNENVNGVKTPDWLDREYYLKMAEDRLNDFENGKGVDKIKNDIKGVRNNIKELVEDINLKTPYPFLNLLYNMKDLDLTNANMEVLIKVGKLSNYGNVDRLLKKLELFKQFGKCKTIKVEKLEKLGLIDYVDIFKNHAEKVTDKALSKIDNESLLNDLFDIIDNDSNYDIDDKFKIIKNEVKYIGYTSTIDSDMIGTVYVIEDILKDDYNRTHFKMYQMKTGKVSTFRLDKNCLDKSPKKYEIGDIINVLFDDYVKKRKVDKKWVPTGETERVIKIFSILT